MPDVIVIGDGPGGLSAALFLAKNKLDVVDSKAVGTGETLLQGILPSFALTDMWTGMVVLGVVGYLLNLAFRRAERLLLRHYPPARSGPLEAR